MEPLGIYLHQFFFIYLFLFFFYYYYYFFCHFCSSSIQVPGVIFWTDQVLASPVCHQVYQAEVRLIY